ncbi:CfaE/CblD family pilus tip adhesin [Robbsia andropogonis]|uniref:CfaE/CblD family pilus tip adhesin n=1 Tax=Robbsia andropogonis TaxID=28092 RepID=UPI003D237611
MRNNTWYKIFFAPKNILFAILTLWNVNVFAYHHTFNFDFDRSTPPSADFVIYGGSDIDKSRYTGLVCNSETDPISGACDTNPGDSSSPPTPGTTRIKLTFREQRSGATAIVDFDAYREYNSDQSSQQCASDGMKTKFNVMGDCNSDLGDTKYYLRMADTVPALPYGGIWKASLLLHQYKVTPSGNKWIQWDTLNLVIKMTDNKNMQMYLPNLSGSKPRVDLRLVANPFAKPDATESGDATIESCLYDGYNSNSTKFTLTVSNPDTSSKGFFVTADSKQHEGNESSTIYYDVSAANPGDPSGTEIPFSSGVPQDFTISPGDQIRPVVLPGINGTVICVPWTLHLHTPAFKQKDQEPGQYNGTLQVSFSPSTDQNP